MDNGVGLKLGTPEEEWGPSLLFEELLGHDGHHQSQ